MVENGQGGETAAELMARLARDPGFQARRQRAEEEREEIHQARAASEQPVVDDLRAAGHDVSSVWDLIDTNVPYPSALPILLRHLQQGGYPSEVLESLGRALAVKPSVEYWRALVEIFRTTRDAGQKEGVAVAIAACVTVAQLDELIELVEDPAGGDDRIFFVEPVAKLGGERGRDVLKKLRRDRDIKHEVKAVLAAK